MSYKRALVLIVEAEDIDDLDPFNNGCEIEIRHINYTGPGIPGNARTVGVMFSRPIASNEFWGVDLRGFMENQANLPVTPSYSFTVADLVWEPRMASEPAAVRAHSEDLSDGSGQWYRRFTALNPAPKIGDFVEVWIDIENNYVRTTINGKDVVI